ncbi:lytic transglycosylase domain-containing protein [Luteimonas sp. e5]
MLPGMELMGCQIDVPASVMHHVVKVESSYNPYAIGVVGGRLARQPRNLEEAVATAEMLEARGFNFSLGLAQVNRYNLAKYGLANYRTAFQTCPNLNAGARILRECHTRSGGHWGKAFSCYYSGNFTTGYRHGYVQKVEASMLAMRSPETPSLAIPVISSRRSGTAAAPASRSSQAAAAPTLPDAVRQRAEAVTASLIERRAGLAAARELTPAQAAAAEASSTPVMLNASADTGPVPARATATPAATPSPSPQTPKNGDAAFVF